MKSTVALLKCNTYEEKQVKTVLHDLLDSIGGIEGIINKRCKVLIKPNLASAHLPERGITTHPKVVKALVQLVRERGSIPFIGDSSIGQIGQMGLQEVWTKTGMNEVAKETGCELVSFEKSGFRELRISREGRSHTYCIANAIFNCDVIINVPKFKTHSLLNLTGAIKNMFGVIPGKLKGMMHCRSPRIFDFAGTLVDIYQLVKPQLNIMDGIIGLEGDGPGARGQKRQIGIMMAGLDAVAIDTIAAKLMNFKPLEVPTTKIATKRGLGESSLRHITILGERLESLIMDDFIHPVTKVYLNNPNLVKKMFEFKQVTLAVDTHLCSGCMVCVKNCPKNAICASNSFPIVNMQKCIECLCCLEICPRGAIGIQMSSFLKR